MQADPDEYGTVTSRYYDHVYRETRGSEDADFYLELAREAAGPVLELGCGTGRVLLPIAREGFPCTGLDASTRMLNELRAKDPPRTLRLVHAPMQDFDLAGDRFTLIYGAFRTFQHLYAVEDQLACLACVKRHLAPGGALAFDVFAPRLDRTAISEEPEREDARFEQGGEEIARYTSVSRDHAAQLMTVRMRYERSRGGEVLGDDVVEFRMRYYFRFEVEHLLARAGFDDVTLYGGFDRRPFDPNGEMVFIARCRS